jgi:hypothetical protein
LFVITLAAQVHHVSPCSSKITIRWWSLSLSWAELFFATLQEKKNLAAANLLLGYRLLLRFLKGIGDID